MGSIVNLVTEKRMQQLSGCQSTFSRSMEGANSHLRQQVDGCLLIPYFHNQFLKVTVSLEVMVLLLEEH